MNVLTEILDQTASDLGCSLSAFPQTYLGLPLPPTKPSASAFHPIVDKCKKNLTRWHAKLLAKGDTLILITVVLDSSPTS